MALPGERPRGAPHIIIESLERREQTMRKVLAAGLMFLAATLASAPAFAEPNFTEGLWEVKGEMKLEGMPFPMPPMPFGYTQCITKKDLVPQKQEKNQECTTLSQKIEGNTVSWTMRCKDASGNVTDSTGSATYAGATFESTMRTVTTDAKKNTSTANMTLKGKRTGACKEK
jgi:hypothetical protein